MHHRYFAGRRLAASVYHLVTEGSMQAGVEVGENQEVEMPSRKRRKQRFDPSLVGGGAPLEMGGANTIRRGPVVNPVEASAAQAPPQTAAPRLEQQETEVGKAATKEKKIATGWAGLGGVITNTHARTHVRAHTANMSQQQQHKQTSLDVRADVECI